MTADRPDRDTIIRPTDDGVEILVSVQPRARHIGIKGIHDGRLRIAVSEPPDDGKANQAVLRLIASLLKVAPGQIEIVRGATSRRKQLRIKGVTLDEARARLLP